MTQTTQTTSTGDATGDAGLVDKIRTAASAQLSTQKDRATDTLGSVAQAIRQSTQTFRDQRQDTLAEYVERAADHVDRLSARLRDRDVSRLIDDTQQFARRQPALFIGAAFTAGMLAARFLKSSGRAGNDRDWRRPAGEGGHGRQSLPVSAGEPRYSGGR
jgi:hypothetical protein